MNFQYQVSETDMGVLSQFGPQKKTVCEVSLPQPPVWLVTSRRIFCLNAILINAWMRQVRPTRDRLIYKSVIISFEKQILSTRRDFYFVIDIELQLVVAALNGLLEQAWCIQQPSAVFRIDFCRRTGMCICTVKCRCVLHKKL